MRLWWGVVSAAVWFVACQPEKPVTVGIVLPDVAAEGLHYFDVWVEPANLPVTVRVKEGDAVVFEQVDAPKGERALSFFIDAGVYVVTAEALRDGGIVASASYDWHVFPTMPVTRRVRGDCQRFAVLNDEATEFECNGTRIDADGGALEMLSGWSKDTRVVQTAGGRVRWVLSNGSLSVETSQGTSDGTAFPTQPTWAAAADFAMTDNQLVMLDGGALASVDWDAISNVWHSFPAGPLAAASRDGRRGFMSGVPILDQNGAPTGHTFCRLEFDVKWRVTSCIEVNGVFLRQELRDGRVLFQNGNQLQWFDLLDAEHPQLIRTLDAGVQFARGAHMKGTWYGSYNTLSRAETLQLVFPAVAADAGEVTGGDVSSDFVWIVVQDGTSSWTYWEPLP